MKFDHKFDVDEALQNIRYSLQDEHRYSQHRRIAEEGGVIELTEIVEDRNFSSINSINAEKEKQLAHKKNHDNISMVGEDILNLKTVAEIKSYINELVGSLNKNNDIEKIEIELIVREEIKQILKTWLDKNLAVLVKDIVYNEIAKVTNSYFKN
jgi:cell pole-organizing protein PopZ